MDFFLEDLFLLLRLEDLFFPDLFFPDLFLADRFLEDLFLLLRLAEVLRLGLFRFEVLRLGEGLRPWFFLHLVLREERPLQCFIALFIEGREPST